MERYISPEELSVWKSVQQRSPEWYKQRRKILTASDIPAILELSPYCTKNELFKKKIITYNEPLDVLEPNRSMIWGQEHEPLAKSFYEKMPLVNGRRRVHDVGLVVHSRYPYIGASPDGVVEGLDRSDRSDRSRWWLLEIKCPYKRHLHVNDRSIPLYIWVQIQIQLEVCDISFCHLFQCKYEKIDGVSRLMRRKLTTVRRDKRWFQETALPVIKEFWCLLDRASKYEYVRNPYPDPSRWVSMKSFTGYLLSDPILDWLDEYRYEPEVVALQDNMFSKTAIDRLKNKDNLFRSLKESFLSFCRDRGYKFLSVTPLEERDRESLSVRRFRQTVKAVQDYVPVISRPVLLNYKKKVFGIPDMLVRNDIALEYFRFRYPDTTTGFRYLMTDKKREKGYVLVCFTLRKDILSNRYEDPSCKTDNTCYVRDRVKTFCLPPPPGVRRSLRIANKKVVDYNDDISDSSDSLDTDKRFFRKWDKVLRVRYAGYSEIVDSILPDKGPCTLTAFLGSEFSYISDPESVNSVKKDVLKGADWVRTIKKDGRKWLISLNPENDSPYPEDTRLMPNMCNKYDQRWRKIKKIMAERWGEITLLWYCGIEQRRRACSKGIFSWKDISKRSYEIVNSFYTEKDEKRPVEISRRRRIIESMINLNRSSDKVFQSRDQKNHSEPYYDIKAKKADQAKEFFVDFEIIPNIGSKESLRRDQPKGMIYLIGMGWIDRLGDWQFRSFVASDLTCSAEKKMMKKWWGSIRDITEEFGALKAVLYHWSGAEPRFLNVAMNHNNNHVQDIEDDIESGYVEFRDLMEMFLDSEVVIRNVWGYSLKDVAKGLYLHGLLPEVWEMGEKGDKGNIVSSGEGSVTTATRCYRQAVQKDIDIQHVPSFASLCTYNQMDCRVLYDLLNFLRDHVYSDRRTGISSSTPIITRSSSDIWGESPMNNRSKRRKTSEYK